jgi:hypothetical protein
MVKWNDSELLLILIEINMSDSGKMVNVGHEKFLLKMERLYLKLG